MRTTRKCGYLMERVPDANPMLREAVSLYIALVELLAVKDDGPLPDPIPMFARRDRKAWLAARERAHRAIMDASPEIRDGYYLALRGMTYAQVLKLSDENVREMFGLPRTPERTE